MSSTKTIEFDRIDSETVDCWVAGDFVGSIVKLTPRIESARRNCRGVQSGAHEWHFVAKGASAPVVLNKGGDLRAAKKQARAIVSA